MIMSLISPLSFRRAFVQTGHDVRQRGSRRLRPHHLSLPMSAQNRKLCATAAPNRRMASTIASGSAAANVVRKNSPACGLSGSAENHDPRATKTPFSIQSSKISSSSSRMLRFPWSGCCVWSTLSQCCADRVRSDDAGHGKITTGGRPKLTNMPAVGASHVMMPFGR